MVAQEMGLFHVDVCCLQKALSAVGIWIKDETKHLIFCEFFFWSDVYGRKYRNLRLANSFIKNKFRKDNF